MNSNSDASPPQVGPAGLTSALAQLKIKYVTHLGGKIQEIDALYPQEGASVTAESLMLLMRLAHKLAGSGKTFDLPAISDTGSVLEALLLKAIDEMNAGMLSPATRAKVSEAVKMTRDACQQAFKQLEMAHAPEKIMVQTRPQRMVFIAKTGDISADTGQLQNQLQYLGYQAVVVDDIAALESDEIFNTPAAIIIITNFSPESVAAIQHYLDKSKTLQEKCPILYFSSEDSFDMRLEAVRLRGDAFLTLPADHLQLIDKLEILVGHSFPNTYHVLVVDDDEILAGRYAIALENAGMSVTVLSDPKRALEVMANASIDLVLLDFDMPGCTGFELASMLRQMDNYIRLPILFLSTQANLDSMLKHTHLGIDEFLTKPVSVEHLVKTVSARAARSTVLHKFIDQDSATGLLNHTRLKKELLMEISRSKRKKTQFTYALLDIDHFKKVNDTFGHAMGDVVIKTLANLLRQRLRFTDIIGRYGGEEFGVILPDAGPEQAFNVLLSIKMQFASIAFTKEKQKFHVTLSGGIAPFPVFETDTIISLAADEALYKAKKQGRNQLVIASPGL